MARGDGLRRIASLPARPCECTHRKSTKLKSSPLPCERGSNGLGRPGAWMASQYLHGGKRATRGPLATWEREYRHCRAALAGRARVCGRYDIGFAGGPRAGASAPRRHPHLLGDAALCFVLLASRLRRAKAAWARNSPSAQRWTRLVHPVRCKRRSPERWRRWPLCDRLGRSHNMRARPSARGHAPFIVVPGGCCCLTSVESQEPAGCACGAALIAVAPVRAEV